MRKLYLFIITLFILNSSLFFINSNKIKAQSTVINLNTTKLTKQEIVNILSTDPIWYQNPRLKPTLNQYFREDEKGKSKEFIKEKREFIQLVGDLLAEGKVKLGKPLENFDEGRKPLESIIIHHTETSPTANLNYINGIHLFTLYILPIFDNPDNSLYKKPVFSGHYNENGKQVFYGYHYIIKPDGTSKKVLKDEYIGYHARGVNSKSIGIAIIGNYSNQKPSNKAINAANDIIKNNKGLKVFGHKEVVPDTDCPGKTFFGENGWKKQLISN